MTAKVIWFTGLSGSGKTSISILLKDFLEEKKKKVLIIDGDYIRENYEEKLTFSKEDIIKNNKRVVESCKNEIQKYDFILVSVITPFQKSRTYTRKELTPYYFEIYVNCPLEECERRDVKGLYAKAKKGEIKNFIGICPATPYEIPENPDLILDTLKDEKEITVRKIIKILDEKKFI